MNDTGLARGVGAAAPTSAEPGSAAPFSEAAFAALRAHPRFRDTVRDFARRNLASYGALAPSERWLFSDLGRAALTGAAVVIDAVYGGFPANTLIQAVVANRTCSEGRARDYLRRAVANGFLDLDRGGLHTVSPRLQAILTRNWKTMLDCVSRLDPTLAPSPGVLDDVPFMRRLAVQVGLNTTARPDLFNGPDKPVMLFLGRDGGARMLDQLVAAQPPGVPHLLESPPVSQRAMAQGAFVSRTHVARLLAEGEALGLLRPEGRRLAVAPELSEDVERHYALILEMARTSAHAALPDPG